jgi:phosphate starvation-inducible PhoH-like protein
MPAVPPVKVSTSRPTSTPTRSAPSDRRKYAARDVSAPSSTQVKILVPGNHLMVGLLGQRDELLRLVETAFPVSIHVRGNEITIRGDEIEAERVGRLFEEMVLLLERGHTLDAAGVGRSIEMLKADQRPTEVLSTEVLRGRKPVRPKTQGQKRYVDAVKANTVTFCIGPAGTGKSYLAVALAVQALQAKEMKRIILTRPAVEAGERLGFLPGDILAKVDPYLRPLYDALFDMLDPEAVTRLMDRGTIEVAPLAFMRGRTLNDSFIILDEAQNTTAEQMKMFLTRLGFGSKIVVTGDVTQIDLAEGRGRSGLLAVRDVLTDIPGLTFIELGSGDVVRHKIVQDIVDAYGRAEDDRAQ